MKARACTTTPATRTIATRSTRKRDGLTGSAPMAASWIARKQTRQRRNSEVASMKKAHVKFAYLAAVAGAMLVPVFVAQAHHSDAMFDREQVRELTGVVREFQFTNPHTWVQL